MILSSRFLAVLFLTLILGLFAACRPDQSKANAEVVVYASQDQVYAEPLLQRFEARSGIRVRAVFDSEAVKTVGLANRLISEKSHPTADLFWNNEMLRTVQLASAGVLETGTNRIVFGSRSRRMVIHEDHLAEAPRDWLELTNARWKGRVALAYPLFGTTATHFLHWRQHWGEAAWSSWCKALIENKPFLVEGNSAVVQLVGRGEAYIGMTDSDDIKAGQGNNLRVVALPESENGLRIPNSVSMVNGAPHPVAAHKLLQYLAQPDVTQELVDRGALETPTPSPPGAPAAVDWNSLEKGRAEGTDALRLMFLR